MVEGDITFSQCYIETVPYFSFGEGKGYNGCVVEEWNAFFPFEYFA